MKPAASLIFVATALCAGIAPAQVTNNYSFTVNPNQTIPDASSTGLTTTTPGLTGMFGAISDISVTLDITSAPGDTAFNGDLYAYLAGPNGGFAVLLNRTGVTGGNSFGYSDTGFNVTFTTSATDNIHLYQSLTYNLNPAGQLIGTWQPDGRAIDPQSSPALFDSSSPTALLGSFDGTDPNGVWTLFLADLTLGNQSEVVSWTLNIQTIPEPSAAALLGLGILLAARKRFSRSR